LMWMLRLRSRLVWAKRETLYLQNNESKKG
jgi:hypothetical protein